MLVQFGNNWIQKIPLTAKLDSAYGLVQFWLSSEFFSSNYFQIGQRVVLLHILILIIFDVLLLNPVGNTIVNIFNVSTATGLSFAYTVMCYPREIKSLTYLLKLTTLRKNI